MKKRTFVKLKTSKWLAVAFILAHMPRISVIWVEKHLRIDILSVNQT